MSELINATPKTDWKLGDTCYFYEPWTESIVKGKITGIRDLDGQPVAAIKMTNYCGNTDRYFNHLFETLDAATEVLRDAKTAQRNAYKAEITDIESLVRFGYDHNIHQCEEYTDWEAREAYAERAAELLGITL